MTNSREIKQTVVAGYCDWFSWFFTAAPQQA